jgi:hypothetical protein
MQAYSGGCNHAIAFTQAATLAKMHPPLSFAARPRGYALRGGVRGVRKRTFPKYTCPRGCAEVFVSAPPARNECRLVRAPPPQAWHLPRLLPVLETRPMLLLARRKGPSVVRMRVTLPTGVGELAMFTRHGPAFGARGRPPQCKPWSRSARALGMATAKVHPHWPIGHVTLLRDAKDCLFGG